jgi:hypothetical protein
MSIDYCAGCSGSSCQSYSAPAPQYGASSGSYSHQTHSALEAAVSPAMYTAKPTERKAQRLELDHSQDLHQPYNAPDFNYAQDLAKYLALSSSQGYNTGHVVDNFLHASRLPTQFIEKADEIKHYVEECFEKTTGKVLPGNITISVLEKAELKRAHEIHGGEWSDGIQGFSLNGNVKHVFVKQNDLDKVMLVLGHELGHVLTPGISNRQTEEAKAFAFEFAWMKTIVDENIANLSSNINLDFMPAENGLHDIAWLFVRKIAKTGKTAMEIYTKIVTGLLSVDELGVDW